MNSLNPRRQTVDCFATSSSHERGSPSESHAVRKRSLLLILELCRQLTTKGWALDESALGAAVYLYSIAANLGGDVSVLREACEETNYVAEVRAALLVVQKVQRIRFGLDDSKNPTRPSDLLPSTAKAIHEAISKCELKESGPNDVRRALEGYRMLSEAEITQLLAELPG